MDSRPPTPPLCNRVSQHFVAYEISTIDLTRQLRLFIDDNGSLRCGRKIHNAPVIDTAKFPILLPKKDHITTLFIHDIHVHQLHAGASSTLTALRQRFFIPAGRYRVKKVVNKYVTCKKVSGFSFQAPVAPLLTSLRLQQSRPFAVTGVYFTDVEDDELDFTLKTVAENPKFTSVCLHVLPPGQYISKWSIV